MTVRVRPGTLPNLCKCDLQRFLFQNYTFYPENDYLCLAFDTFFDKNIPVMTLQEADE